MDSFTRDVFHFFDEVFKDFISLENVPKNLYFSGGFPPHNVYVDRESKDMVIECALAGYNKDDIQIDFEDDRLYLSIDKKEEKQDENKACIYRGIKGGKSKIYFIVPFSKYDVDKTTATFKDGILTIKIPAFESLKKKKIMIEG